MEPRCSMIGLVVADMATSLAFYRALGVAVEAAADSEAHVEVQLGGGVRLGWDTVEVIRSFDPGWTPPSGSRAVALAFDCGDPAGVDRVYGTLTAAGHRGHLPPWDAFWGQRYAVVLDPDDNPVDLFAASPASS